MLHIQVIKKKYEISPTNNKKHLHDKSYRIILKY